MTGRAPLNGHISRRVSRSREAITNDAIERVKDGAEGVRRTGRGQLGGTVGWEGGGVDVVERRTDTDR